jgi:3-methyladenine DNA glycosylase AlkD
MTLKQILAALQKAGTAQNRKVYGRHGVHGDQYGVSFADLGKLKKRIGTDHELACGLWATGNHDARVLATMVADPAAMTSRDLDAWARDMDNYVVTDAYSTLVLKSGKGARKFEAWKNRRSEFVAATAWNVLAGMAQHEGTVLEDAWLREQLDQITAEIHDRPNRVRHSMNQALICIGVRGGAMEKAARSAARKIGKVEVDHGQTSCRTPDAAAYLDKVLDHRAKKKKKKQARA